MELTPHQKEFALYVARTLDDMDWLTFLREKLTYVMSLPSSKIKNSRAAYYIFLVTGNAKRNRPRA
jgi:hypothetical protein